MTNERAKLFPFRFAVAVFFAVTTATVAHATTTPQRPAYIEPSLLQRHSFPVSVIVTADQPGAAARAVKRHGGRVASDLWIIDAVSAVVEPEVIPGIALEPAVVSIVDNKRVASADWNGWTSDVRIVRNTYTMPAAITAPAATLVDGGFAGVSSDGTLLIGNDDGSERKRVLLPKGPYNQTPRVTVDGNILVISNTAAATLLRPDGSIIWQSLDLSSTQVDGNAVIGSNGLFYIADEYRTLIGVSLADGTVKAKKVLGDQKSSVTKTPAIAADNSVYVVTNKGDVLHADASGNLLWSYNVGSYVLEQPQVASDGSVWVVAPSSTHLWVLEPTGAVRFSFTAPYTISTNPLLTSTGAYLGTQLALYALALNGQIRFADSANTLSGGLTGAYYDTTPVLSLDGTMLHISSKGLNLHTVTINASTGSVIWRYTLGTNKLTLPVVDPEGGVTIGDSSGGIQRFAPNSAKLLDSYRFKSTAVNALSYTNATGTLVGDIGTYQFAWYGRLPDQWNGRKDVVPGSRNTRYRVVNPVTIDVGANILHNTKIAAATYVTGVNTVVAILDSGVFWDPNVTTIMGPTLQHQFIGQADFVTTKCFVNPDGTLGGVQYPDYCFADYNHSLDAYGHGTHVAGIMSNKLTEEATNVYLGVAPDAQIVSARVLGSDGSGTYDLVIKGLQWIVANRPTYNIRVLNLSLSAYSTTPYFVDPLDRAVEKAWQAGIVVCAAAGNTGPFAQTITVPGNDPYVITVGAVSEGRTPAYWKDDVVTKWSATGPTYDGFPKPDVVAPGSQIISYMYNGGLSDSNTPTLVRLHPDYSQTTSLFRMNGTSMATGIASGIVALMLQVNPALTPDQVKYRLTQSARWSQAPQQGGEPAYNTFQQGLGRVWAPDAVMGTFDSSGSANQAMDINSDLAHGYATYSDLSFHYQGPVRRMLDSTATAYGYYATDASTGNPYLLGVTDLNGNWLDSNAAGTMIWGGGTMIWGGGLSFTGDAASFAATRMIWGGTNQSWASTRMIWGGTRMIWGGGTMIWGGGLLWAGGQAWSSAYLNWADPITYGSTRMIWGGALSTTASGSGTTWVGDDWIPPATSTVPGPAAATP